MSKNIQFINEEDENIYPHPYYPIGSIYLSVNNTNPSTWFEGTWELIAKGRTLVGVDANDTDFNEAKKTGGEKTHKLTTSEMPSHAHRGWWRQVNGSGSEYVAGLEDSYEGETGTYIDATLSAGGSQAHNNMQPFFTCYIWCRVA